MEPKTAHYLHAAPATLPMLPELLSPIAKIKRSETEAGAHKKKGAQDADQG